MVVPGDVVVTIRKAGNSHFANEAFGVEAGKVVVHRCHGNLRALFLEAQIHLFCCWMIGGGIDGIKNDLRVLVHFRSSSTFELE